MIGLAAVLALMLPSSNAGDPKEKDIVEAAVSTGKFKTLATALEAAGLIDTLKGKGPFTVFAPTDEAFAKLPKETLDALLKDKQRLTALLTYHVAAKNVASAEIVKFETARLKSVEGSPIAIDTAGGTVTLNGSSKVIQADLVCRNGVIHVIDTVILPTLFKDEADKTFIIAFCESSYDKDVIADAKAGNWDKAKERNKEFQATLKRLGEITPKLGTKDSWDLQVKFLVRANKNIETQIANQNEVGVPQAVVGLRAQCFACHLLHKAR
jgi:uncharacterized surface protein with fasciclin (FAS1) repeats